MISTFGPVEWPASVEFSVTHDCHSDSAGVPWAMVF